MSDLTTPNTVPTSDDDENPFVSYNVGSTPEDTFAIPFQFWQNEDLSVKFNGLDQIGWNTTGAGNPAGGSLTLGSPVSDGVLTIQRYVSEERITVFPIAGPFRIEQLNQEFDHMIAMIADRRFVGESDQVTWDDVVGKPDVVVWDDLYPVGSVHITFNNAPPPRGTWQLVSEGTFLLAAGGGTPADSTGGEATATASHTLTTDEMPRHSHTADPATFTSGSKSQATSVRIGTRQFSLGTGGLGYAPNNQNGMNDSQIEVTNPLHDHNVNVPQFGTGDTGQGQQFDIPHNNIPPYIAAYMWRRTA